MTMPNELNIVANRRSLFFYSIIMLYFCHTNRTELHLVKVRLPFDSMAMLILCDKVRLATTWSLAFFSALTSVGAFFYIYTYLNKGG